MKKKKKGFTLTEVLVVVLVIGVLSAIAYPVYTKAVNKSRAIEAINLLDIVRTKQIASHARTGKYISDFGNMGQLTGNKNIEVAEGNKMTVGKYYLTINDKSSCLSASYISAKGKQPSFTFSTSYENPGLGCEGDICSSFGNIVGTATEVCACVNDTCPAGYSLDSSTCDCICSLECNQGGVCSSKSQNKPTSQSCGQNNSGTQTRTCTASCSGGDCSSWGACTGQSCDQATKPAASRSCGNKCGAETGVVSCDNGSWKVAWSGSCSAEGVCEKGQSKDCGNGGKQICGNDCSWGACTGELMCNIGQQQRRTCPDNPEKYQTREFKADGTWTEWTGDCSQDAPPQPKECTTLALKSKSCSAANCGTQTRSATCDTTTGQWTYGAWGSCVAGGDGCKPGTFENGIPCTSINQPCTKWESRTCNSSCIWDHKLPGQCTGECTPGEKKLVMCGTNTGYNPNGTESFIYREVTCSSNCTFPTPAPCNQCVEHPNCGKDFGGGLTGPCYCMLEGLPVPSLPPAETVCLPDSMCEDCGGTWNCTTNTCDCGFHLGNACRFVAGRGCLCGDLYRSCR